MKRVFIALIFMGGLGAWQGVFAAQVGVEGVLVSVPSPTCAVVRVDQIEQVACGEGKMWRGLRVGDRVSLVGEKDAHTAVLTVAQVKKLGHDTVATSHASVAVWQGTWLGTHGQRVIAPAIAEILSGDRLHIVSIGTDTILNSRFDLTTLPDFADGDRVTVVAEQRGDGWHARLVHNQTLEQDHGSRVGVIEGVYLTPRPTLRIAHGNGTCDVLYFDQTQFLRGRTVQDLRKLILPGAHIVLRGRTTSPTELLATHVWLLP